MFHGKCCKMRIGYEVAAGLARNDEFLKDAPVPWRGMKKIDHGPFQPAVYMVDRFVERERGLQQPGVGADAQERQDGRYW